MVGSACWTGRQCAERREQRLAVVIDRPHAVAFEEAGEHPLHDLPVGEHVGDAARHAQVVLEHGEPAAGAVADEIGAGDRDVGVAAHAQAAHLPAVVRAAVDQVARHDPFGEDAAVVVDVLQEEIERVDALRQTALEVLPLRAGQHARQQIVREDPLRALVVAVHREGDALVEERAVGRELTDPQLVDLDLEQPIEEHAGRSRAARRRRANISSKVSSTS